MPFMPRRRVRAALLSITLTGALAVAALPGLSADAAAARRARARGTRGGRHRLRLPLLRHPRPPARLCGCRSASTQPPTPRSTATPARSPSSRSAVRRARSPPTSTPTARPRPFATDLAAAEDAQAPGTFQVSLEPDATWPAGRIRMVVKDTAGDDRRVLLRPQPAARDRRHHPGGRRPPAPRSTSPAPSRSTAPGPRSPAAACPPRPRLQLTSSPPGTVLSTPGQTAAADGTFTVPVPAGETVRHHRGRHARGARRSDASYDDTTPPAAVPAPGRRPSRAPARTPSTSRRPPCRSRTASSPPSAG